MQFELLQENLAQALRYLQKSIPTKPQLPILSCLLVRAESKKITLATTDLYFGMQTEVDGNVLEEGVLAIPGKTLCEVIFSLPAGKIILSTVDTKIQIKSGKNIINLQSQPADDYPSFPEVSGTQQPLSQSQLEEIEQKVRFAAASDPTRPVLTSINCVFKPQTLETVATDGFRLATLTFNNVEVIDERQLLIPARAMSEIYRIAQQEKIDQVMLLMNQELKQAFVVIGHTTLYVRLLDGEYPPYEKIIPTQFAIQAQFEADSFLEELKRASIFARDSSHIVKIKLDDQQQRLVIMASSSTQGSYEGGCEAEIKGGGGEIAFNSRYLLEFLANVKPERMWLGMNESLKPALIRPLGADNYRYVVMPFRVQG